MKVKFSSAVVVLTLGLFVEPALSADPVGTCETGWKQFGSSCYKLGETHRDYYLAEYWCTLENAHLASLHSEEEQSFVTANVLSTRRLTWIGYNRVGNEWKWTDRSSATDFINWLPGHPMSTIDCAATYRDNEYLWYSIDCARSESYVCEKDAYVAPVLTCEAGWQQYEESCYKAGDANLTYFNAESFCAQEEAHLTSIHSDGERDYVTTNVSESAFDLTWIGFTKVTGEWKWTDDSEATTYIKWDVQQPPEGNLCTGLKKANLLWQGMDCTIKAPYVCEKAAKEAVTETTSTPTTLSTTTTTTTATTPAATSTSTITPTPPETTSTPTTSSTTTTTTTATTPAATTTSTITPPPPETTSTSTTLSTTTTTTTATTPAATTTSTTTPTPPVLTCEAGWQQYEESCYKAGDANRTYFNAESFCDQQGAHLTSLHSDGERDYVTTNVSKSAFDLTWIGFTKVTGEWKWTDDSEATTYIKWDVQQPPEGNLCTGLKKANLLWQGMDCTIKAPYVCEKAAKEAVTETTSTPTTLSTTTTTTTATTPAATSTSTITPTPPETTSTSTTLSTTTTTTTATTPAATTTSTTTPTPPVYTCEEGWTQFASSCYKTGGSTQALIIGNHFCKNVGAHVASIHSDEENEFVAINMSMASTNYEWVGLMDTGSGWMNLDGTLQDYNKWVAGQPKNYNCTAINKLRNYQWDYVDCATLTNYVCKKNASVELVPENITCEAGWTPFNSAGSCYRAATTNLTFNAAEADCQGAGAHVVSIDSADEQKFVEGLLPNRQWIGLEKENGIWNWQDGTALNWTNELDQTKNGPCALMRHPNNGGTWVAVGCHRSELYVCEKKAV